MSALTASGGSSDEEQTGSDVRGDAVPASQHRWTEWAVVLAISALGGVLRFAWFSSGFAQSDGYIGLFRNADLLILLGGQRELASLTP